MFWPPEAYFLTRAEWWVLYAVTLGALVGALVSGHPELLAALLVVLLALPRTVRRGRAAARAGLDGFVAQLPAVGDAERQRKIAALSAQVRNWEPGRAWVRQLDRRLIEVAARDRSSRVNR